MTIPGPHNLITDVKGLTVGHGTCETAASGVTVLRCDEGFVAAVDVRGGAPGTRETDVLDTNNLVGRAHAIVISGGSVFGLAAADSVAAFFSDRNTGLRLGDKGPAIPIVPAAVLHDLTNEGDKNWGDTPPYRQLGLVAVCAAGEQFALGAVGAGRGARAGSGPGGLGSSSIALENSVTVGALVAVNPVGSVFMPDGKTFYAWPFEQDGEFGARPAPIMRESADPFPPFSRLSETAQPGANTTIAIVATSANLSRSEAKRVAIMAHDGIARAIRPAHTAFDGDIVFSVATGAATLSTDERQRAVDVAAIGSAAADTLARAIARGVHEALAGA